MTPLRGLLVGAGGMGRGWAENLAANPHTELAGWVDIRPGAAAQAADDLKLSVGHTGDDLARALAELRPDFLVDVTVPEAHHDVTLAALAAGVPVIGEKPMAMSMDEARAMVAASERAGKLYMVSQSRRYNAALHAYRRLIGRACGDVGILNADFYIGAHFGGFRDAMANVLLLDMAIHTFDAARYLLGDPAPVAVYCDEFSPPWSWYAGGASATAIFELEGGARFTYRGSWCAEGRSTSWEGEWRAVGPGGSATWDGAQTLRAERVSGTDGFIREVAQDSEPIEPDYPYGIRSSLRDFVAALRTGATPMGECHDNIKSLAMVLGAIESAATGQRVRIAY